MPEDGNNAPRRRISFGFLFSIILIVGLIGILVWRIFGNYDRSTHLTLNQYVQALVDKRVEDATVTMHYNEMVVITGTYSENENKKTYTFTTDKATYENSDIEYKVTSGGATVTIQNTSLNTLISENVKSVKNQ